MDLKGFLEIVVNIFTVLAVGFTAVLAVIKFQLYEVFVRRYNTEMKVEQKHTKDGKIYLICTYIIENIGELPISLSEVKLEFYEAIEKLPDTELGQTIGTLLCSKKKNTKPLQKKRFYSSNKKYRDLLRISAGEKSEFPIRGILEGEKEAIFIYGSFKWKNWKNKSLCFKNKLTKISKKIPRLQYIIKTITYEKKPADYHHTVLIYTNERSSNN